MYTPGDSVAQPSPRVIFFFCKITRPHLLIPSMCQMAGGKSARLSPVMSRNSPIGQMRTEARGRKDLSGSHGWRMETLGFGSVIFISNVSDDYSWDPRAAGSGRKALRPFC